MNSKTLTNYYVWGMKALIFVIPFLSLWIASSMYFPYITGRNFAFRILIEIAFVLWAGLMVIDKRYRPRLTPLLATLTIFVAVVGLADLFGVNPHHSFWSRFERMEGYLMILHLFAYFLILTSIFRTKKEWLLFFNIVVIAGILVGFYGVLQKLGIKASIQGGEERIDGTIGNPTYLAAYLLLVTTLLLVLFFNARKRWLKWAYGIVIFYNFLIIYFSSTRGIFLALGIVTPIFLVLYVILLRKHESERLYRKIALACLGLLVLLPIGFWTMRNQPWVRGNPVLSRFASLSFGEKTVRSRFMIWNMSWQAFKERPLLGWGQENYLQAFAKFYNPRMYDQEAWFDRAHNIMFDWLINAGVLGLLSYFSLFVMLYVSVFHAFRNNLFPKKEGLILVVAPLAYFIQNIFVFDNFNTYVLFFALLAYVNGLRSQKAETPSEMPGAQDQKSSLSLGVTSGLLALMLVIIYIVNIKPILQAKGIIQSLIATTNQTNPIGLTLATFKKTLSYNTFGSSETLEQLSRVAKLLMGQKDIPLESKAPFVHFAITRLEKHLQQFPNDIRMRLFLGDLYFSSTELNGDFLTKARDHFRIALELSPTRQEIYASLANTYLVNNEFAKAFELIEKAITLETTNLEMHGNKVVVAIFAGRNDVVQHEIEQMNQLQLKNQELRSAYIHQLERIAGFFTRTKQFNNAKMLYRELVELVPSNVNFREELEKLTSNY